MVFLVARAYVRELMSARPFAGRARKRSKSCTYLIPDVKSLRDTRKLGKFVRRECGLIDKKK